MLFPKFTKIIFRIPFVYLTFYVFVDFYVFRFIHIKHNLVTMDIVCQIKLCMCVCIAIKRGLKILCLEVLSIQEYVEIKVFYLNNLKFP